MSELSQQPHQAHVLAKYSSPSARWAACIRRDPLATSLFVYAVVSTRIYCRPNCGSRLARRSNVVFYDNAGQAELKGFRACKRCRPEEQSSNSDSFPLRKKIETSLELLQESANRGEAVKLADLAIKVGVSKWHLLRVFKRTVGSTPSEISRSMRSVQEATREQHAPAWSDSRYLTNTDTVCSNAGAASRPNYSSRIALDCRAPAVGDYVDMGIKSSNTSQSPSPVTSITTNSVKPTISVNWQDHDPTTYSDVYSKVLPLSAATTDGGLPSFSIASTAPAPSVCGAELPIALGERVFDDPFWTEFNVSSPTYTDQSWNNLFVDLFPDLCTSEGHELKFDSSIPFPWSIKP